MKAGKASGTNKSFIRLELLSQNLSKTGIFGKSARDGLLGTKA